MAVAGTLLVNILASTIGFGRGIGRARKDLAGFRRDAQVLNVVVGGLKKTIGGVFGALSIRAGFNFLNQQLKVADALAKTAQTLDLTTEELGLFQFAAKRAGVDSRQLNISIQRMSRRIGEAALGGGELSKTLDKLGIDAQKLSRLSVGDQFLEMGRALSQITNQDERLAAIFKTFDSEGVPVFRIFGKNLDDARRAFARFNLELDSTDAQKLEKLSDEATLLKAAFGAAGRNFLVEISPDVLKAMTRLEDLLAPRAEGEEPRGETAFEKVSRQVRELREIDEDKEGFAPPGETETEKAIRIARGSRRGVIGGAILRNATSIFKQSQDLILAEATRLPVLADKRNLPFGPVPRPSPTLQAIGQGAEAFNEAVFIEPLKQIMNLLRQISGNTKPGATGPGL